MTTPVPFPQTSATPVGPVVPLPTGVRIDRFVIEQTLHQGSHGFAYRVRESGHHQPLVLLECFPRALAIRQPDGAVRARQAGDAIALSVVCEAFVQDARALAAVDHPGVVKIYGVINANRTVYRLMPFIEGQTLEEQRLERPEPPTVGGLVRLYDKLLDALEALHKAGFVHGLVQPEQIVMKSDDNAPVLLGMDGVAIELGEVTMSPWAAPEQQQSTRFERVNTAADLYMLAATMCFAATGAAPPRSEERLAGEPWDPAALLAGLTLGGGDSPQSRDAFIQAVSASLALAPAARPQRADDVRHILHPQGNDAFVASTGPSPLWVGEMPDRDSQWDRIASGPAPLRDAVETRPMLLPEDGDDFLIDEAAPVAATATRAVPSTRDPAAADGPSLEARRADDAPAHAAPRSAEALSPHARRANAAEPLSRQSRGVFAGVGALALAVAALAWWSQRPVGPLTLTPTPGTAATPRVAPPAVAVTPPATGAVAVAPVAVAPVAVPPAASAPAAATVVAAPPPAVVTAPAVSAAPPIATAPAPLSTNSAATAATAATTATAATAATAATTAAAAVAATARTASAPAATAPSSAAPAARPAAAAAAVTPAAPAARAAAAVPAARTSAAAPAARTTAAAPKPAAKPAAKPVARRNGSNGSSSAASKSASRNGASSTKATTAAKPAPAATAAEAACGNRTQFAYLYCMQELCARAAQRGNAQCATLRRNGELR